MEAGEGGERERGLLLEWLHRRRDVTWASTPEDFDPVATARTVERLGRFFGDGRWLGLDVRGLERVGEPPVLIVSNHSGGTSIPDVWGFAIAWYRHFGVARPLHFLAHEIIVGTRTMGRWFGARGVLRANRENALHALAEARHDLMIMPGGDLDVWRPNRDRYRVRFSGRTGYARLAREAGVKIVPVANAGAHDTFYVLSDGRWLARAMHLHRLARADIWPIHLSLPWGLAIGPWPHLPLPATLRYRIGEPIDTTLHAGDDDEAVTAIDVEVRTSIQRMLDELREQARSGDVRPERSKHLHKDW